MQSQIYMAGEKLTQDMKLTDKTHHVISNIPALDINF